MRRQQTISGIIIFWLMSSVPMVYAEAFVAGLNAIDRQHYSTAFRAFKPMAEQGIAEAQNNIGFLYEKGFGVKRNYATAIGWYTRSANQDLPEAQHNLGMLNYRGYGVEQNMTIAKRWFTKASGQNLGPSHYMLGLIYYEGNDTQKNPIRARVHFQQAAELGDINGQFMFAYMLASGEGKKEEKNTFSDFGSIFESDSNIDLKAAFLWARIASLNGYRDAENLAEFIRFQIDDNVILEIEALAEKCLESSYRNCSVT
jgi:TPR repeat protein